MANEGRCVLFIPEADAKRALEILKTQAMGAGATLIGKVVEDQKTGVLLQSLLGVPRIVEKISGEQLPRIC